MKKRAFVAIFAIIFAQIVFSATLQDFAYSFLREQKVPENHARTLAKTLEEEATKVPDVID
ncbi:MAG TPA: hypothetical protein PLQ59_03450, partial [Fervidobacterium sp.]|nr:hypothetical protein [Fervidobacterium sp.]